MAILSVFSGLLIPVWKAMQNSRTQVLLFPNQVLNSRLTVIASTICSLVCISKTSPIAPGEGVATRAARAAVISHMDSQDGPGLRLQILSRIND
jgi:hypothetical protein